MDRVVTIGGVSYEIVRLLGRGKGGYSYLAESGGRSFVVKQVHHEPCDYYQFGDKLQSELDDYARLDALGLPMPRLLGYDRQEERLVKEYIEGKTSLELVREGADMSPLIAQIEQMCRVLYPAGLNIDYFPTNFIWSGGRLFYIDYECNEYSDRWNFENWGIKYWSMTDELRTYLSEHGEE